METDSDITPAPVAEPVIEIKRIYEIRVQLQQGERARFWTGNDFSPKPEEVMQFETRADAEEIRAGLRAGAYIVSVGL